MAAVTTPKHYLARSLAYNSTAKQGCVHKRAQNAVLGAVAGFVGMGKDDRAFVLDDDGMASSKALVEAARMTPDKIMVVNFGDAAKLAKMKAHGVATVVHGDAFCAIQELSGEHRVMFLDACCTAASLGINGTIPAAVARLSKTAPSLLGITFAFRGADKHRVTDPETFIFDTVKRAAKLYGLRLAQVFSDRYKMCHLLFLLAPTACSGWSELSEEAKIKASEAAGIVAREAAMEAKAAEAAATEVKAQAKAQAHAQAHAQARTRTDAAEDEIWAGCDSDVAATPEPKRRAKARAVSEDASASEAEDASVVLVPPAGMDVFETILDARPAAGGADEWEYRVLWAGGHKPTWETAASFFPDSETHKLMVSRQYEYNMHRDMVVRERQRKALRKKRTDEDDVEYKLYRDALNAVWEQDIRVTADAASPAAATRRRTGHLPTRLDTGVETGMRLKAMIAAGAVSSVTDVVSAAAAAVPAVAAPVAGRKRGRKAMSTSADTLNSAS